MIYLIWLFYSLPFLFYSNLTFNNFLKFLFSLICAFKKIILKIVKSRHQRVFHLYLEIKIVGGII